MHACTHVTGLRRMGGRDRGEMLQGMERSNCCRGCKLSMCCTYLTPNCWLCRSRGLSLGGGLGGPSGCSTLLLRPQDGMHIEAV